MKTNIESYYMNVIRYRVIVLLSVLIMPFIASGQIRDLSLSDALSMALMNNYGVRIAGSDSQIASINNSWANAGRMPTIGFTATTLNSTGIVNASANTSRITSGLALRWTIFDGFKVSLTMEKLSLQEDFYSVKRAIVMENTIEAVMLAYYDVLLQKERLKAVETIMNLSKDRYDYELIRQNIGPSTTYNVLQAKNSYLSDKADFLIQEVTVRNSVRNLNYLLGEDASVNWSFTENFDPVTTDFTLSDLQEKMVSYNAVLKNQYINLMITKNETELRRGDFYPSLNLTTGLDNSNNMSGANSGFNNGTLNAYANVTFSFDIYRAGSTRRAVEIAKINEDIANVESEEMMHSLTNQLFSLYDLYNVRKELYLIAGEALDAAQLNMEISGEKYRAGVINSFNYRDIQLIYLNTALLRLQTIYNLIGSNASLTRLTGGFIAPADQN